MYHAGIGWLNSQYPHEHQIWGILSIFSSLLGAVRIDHSLHPTGDDVDAMGNIPVPYHELQGLSTRNKRVNKVRLELMSHEQWHHLTQILTGVE